MKVMVATARTQGQRENDYYWCVEGELVWFGQMCAGGKADPDAHCGCGRGFAGMSSHRATTTAEVRELDITYEEFQLALESSLEDQGWSLDCLDHDARVLSQIASAYPEGAILERRRYDIRNRWWATERS